MKVSFSKSNLFDEEFLRYILIIDKTGDIENCFSKLSLLYTKRVTNKIKIYTKLIEPISIIIVAIIIGSLVLSIMLPLFSIDF